MINLSGKLFIFKYAKLSKEWLPNLVQTIMRMFTTIPRHTWFILQTTTEGKNTSDRGAVIVSTVITTVEFMKSMVLLYKKVAAHPIAMQTIPDQKICLKPKGKKHITLTIFLSIVWHLYLDEYSSLTDEKVLPAQNPSFSGVPDMYCHPWRLVWLQKAMKFPLIFCINFTFMIVFPVQELANWKVFSLLICVIVGYTKTCYPAHRKNIYID